MATHTLGTNATNSLTCITFSAGADLTDADLSAIALAILNDANTSAPVWPGAFARNGLLFIPNRGVLKVNPGDVVAVDESRGCGWPILVSAQDIANGAWTYV